VQFDTNNGLIYAHGIIAATLYDSGSAVIGTIFEPLKLRARVSDASCSPATLTFGPNVRTIDGVSFLISAVSTTITAQPDVPLVGDVLCAIADLTALASPPGSAFASARRWRRRASMGTPHHQAAGWIWRQRTAACSFSASAWARCGCTIPPAPR
jgi:hypothetical protein